MKLQNDEIEIEFDNDIFNPIYIPYLDCHQRFLHLWGGAGSGKSVFACQKIIIRCLEESPHKFLILRKTFRSHRQSTYALFHSLINKYGLSSLFNFNKTDLSITCMDNGNEIIFAGLDDIEKLKSITDITGIWIEEATEGSNTEIRQINLRLRGITKYYKQIILTYNPIDEYHHLNNDFHKKERSDSILLKTTYLDNIFIDEQYKVQLRNLENDDPTYHKIYALGEWATFKGLIYSNWCVDITEPSNFEDFCYALDFGFTNNPSAFGRIGKIGNDLYIKELIYESHLLTNEIISKFKELGISKTVPIYCDSAEPKSIEEIRQAGFNAKASNKEVIPGIDYVKRFKLHLFDSPNIETEIKAYKWKESKVTGELINEPVKFRDHTMDFIRYGAYTHGIKYWSYNKVLTPPFQSIKRKSITEGY